MGTFVAGYLVVWLSLAGYVGWIGVRQRRLAQRYEALREQLESDNRHDRDISRAA